MFVTSHPVETFPTLENRAPLLRIYFAAASQIGGFLEEPKGEPSVIRVFHYQYMYIGEFTN